MQVTLSEAPKSSFAAVVDARTRVLILGSLPGEISLQRRQYYANPSNQFWRLVGGVIGENLAALAYEDRLPRLLAAGVGLWDVIKSARRSGSLDSAIQDHQANALADLERTLPDLKAIGFNGGKSSAIGRGQLGTETGYELITLPSSSAAYCAIPFERKLDQWLALRVFL